MSDPTATERRQALVSAYAATFTAEAGQLVLDDLRANTAGDPGARAKGAPSSGEFVYETGYHAGRRSVVEDIETLIREGLNGTPRQEQAE